MKDAAPEKPQVRLKGVGKSLCVTIDPQASADELEIQIAQLLDGLKDQVLDSEVTLDAGSQDENADLVDRLGRFIIEHYGVRSVTRTSPRKNVPSIPMSTDERTRKRDLERGWHNHGSETLMMAGRVRSGQKVTANRHVVIMGDVNPGAEVIAGGDIIILGSLLGTAVAGQPDTETSIILALDFRPTQIQIAHYVAAGTADARGKTIEFAHVENGTIIVDHYMDANPFAKLRWPQVR